MNELEYLTLGIAVAGLTLGIYNAWRQTVQEQVRLLVKPLEVYHLENGSVIWSDGKAKQSDYIRKDHIPTIGVEVTNISTFAVWLDEVGLTKSRSRYRVPFIQLQIMTNSGIAAVYLPRKLEPRETIKLIVESKTTIATISQHKVKAAYAITGCNLRFTGSSKALERILAKYRELAEKLSH